MPSAPGNLRLTNRSVIIAVGLLGLTLLLLRLLSSSTRVLGWVAVAAIGAVLLYPLVGRLDRRLPRGLAVAAAVLGTAAVLGLLAYLGIDAVSEQARRLQREAPRAAARVEESERFGEPAREFELREKVQSFVDELPDRLRGGTPAEALRANATRGVAFLATTVLMIFLLVHGPRLLDAGLDQIGDVARQARARRVLRGAYRRAVTYVALTAGRAVLAGVFAWAVSRWADLPGPVLLGMIVAVTSVVPLFGVVLGSVPLLLFTAAADAERVVWVALLIVGWQAVDAVVVQPRLDRASLHVGPVLTLLAGMVGFELYGVGGMAVAVLAVVFLAGLGVEMAPTDESELLSTADTLLPGDER